MLKGIDLFISNVLKQLDSNHHIEEFDLVNIVPLADIMEIFNEIYISSGDPNEACELLDDLYVQNSIK